MRKEAELNDFIADRLGREMSNYDMAKEVFDYFQDKTCDKCMHSDSDGTCNILSDFIGSRNIMFQECFADKGFGCNRWKSK